MPRITPERYQTLVKFFESRGFVVDRQKGSHIQLVREGTSRPLTIPAYAEVHPRIIKNLLNTSGISREEYLNEINNFK